jgi:MFS family permease
MPAIADAPKSRLSQFGSIIGGSIGNLVEWYDWYVYSVFSLYFAATFFPGNNQTTQMLNTAGIFAIGFLMRPIGGWLMGAYADRKGRKSALTLSVIMMCGGSLLIAVVLQRRFYWYLPAWCKALASAANTVRLLPISVKWRPKSCAAFTPALYI